MLAPGNLNQTLMVSMDALKREDIPILFRKHGYQRLPFFMELFTLNMESTMDQDTFYHHEDEFWSEPLVCFGITAGGAAGANVTIQIAVSNITNGTTTFLRKNDNLLFPGRVTGQIVDVVVNGANDIDVVVKPHVATQSIPATVANQRIGVLGNAKARGSGQPASIVPKTAAYSHKFQIIAETTGIEGSLLAEAQWITSDSLGRDMPGGVWTEATLAMEYRQNVNISNALLFQNLTTNGNVDANTGQPVQTTEGFFNFAAARGQALPIALNAFTMDDFDDIIRYQKTQFIGKYSMFKLPINRYMEIEDVVGTRFEDSNIPQIAKQANEDIPGTDALNATQIFKFLARNGVVYYFNEFEELNDNQTFPQDGEYAALGTVFPVGNKRISQTDKAPSPIMGYRYKAKGGYTRRMEMWKVGAAGGQSQLTYTGDIDQLLVYLRSEVASDYKLGNQVVTIPIA